MRVSLRNVAPFNCTPPLDLHHAASRLRYLLRILYRDQKPPKYVLSEDILSDCSRSHIDSG
jgi:hypothetical protein